MLSIFGRAGAIPLYIEIYIVAATIILSLCVYGQRSGHSDRFEDCCVNVHYTSPAIEN